MLRLDELDESGKGLTDWEINFIDSLMKQYDADPTWSPPGNQAEKLQQIYDKWRDREEIY